MNGVLEACYEMCGKKRWRKSSWTTLTSDVYQRSPLTCLLTLFYLDYSSLFCLCKYQYIVAFVCV